MTRVLRLVLVAAAVVLLLVLSRRLLMVGGTSGFALPGVVPTTLGIDGFWSHQGSPRAVRVGDVTLISAVIGGSSGDSVVHAFDLVAESSSSFVLHAALGGAEGNPDHHGNAAILVRSQDGKLLTAYSGHDDSTVRTRLSTNAAPDITAFAAETGAGGLTGNDYTYMSLHQLNGETNDPIYLCYRDYNTGTAVGRLGISKTTTGATPFGTEVILFSPAASARTAYWKIADNGTDRIDFFVTDGSMPAETPPVKTYHFYLTGGAYFKSDGTALGSPPFAPADLTLVYDSSDGPGWPFDAVIAPDGTPRLLLQVAVDSETDNSLRDYRWSGSAWVGHEIARSDGIWVANISPGAVYDHMNPERAYLSRLVSGTWEMFDATTTDDGVTWETSQITINSSEDQLTPTAVENHDGRMPVLWGAGPYTTYTDFDTSIVGLVLN